MAPAGRLVTLDPLLFHIAQLALDFFYCSFVTRVLADVVTVPLVSICTSFVYLRAGPRAGG